MSLTVPSLRARLVRGAQGQVLWHAARVVAQIVGVSVLIAAWGVRRYGDWVILAAVPTYLAFSDVGFTGAATNEMTMAVGQDDHARAREAFRAVSLALLAMLVLLAITLPVVAVTVPLGQLLNLHTLSGPAAGWTFAMLGFDALLTVFAGLLYGALASTGAYGEGGMLMAGTMLAEFGLLAGAALTGGGPPVGAAAMLAGQAVGTVIMFGRVRRRAHWLTLGRPAQGRATLRRLASPALAAGAIPGALALNVQGMVIVVGVTLGPAAAAVFSTLRTLTRSVTQVVTSVAAILSPELSRAFAVGDRGLVRMLNRRGCQAAVWLALPAAALLALFGNSVLQVWTHGKIGSNGALLYLFLITAVIDSLWYTSLTMLYAINRHQRVALIYVLGSLLSLPLAYATSRVWGLNGPAVTLLIIDLAMLTPVFKQALPLANDRLRPWALALMRPPVTPAALLRGLRARQA